MDILKLISRHWINLAKAHIGKSAGRPSKACPPLIGRVKPYDGHDDDDDDDDDDDGLPAYSHHDKIPPWWEYVSNDKGGNVSLSKSHHT